MVLQNIRVSNGAQHSNAENAPPQANGSSSRPKKGLISRVYQDAAARRRTRGMGSTTRTPKYRADQAKRRADSQPRSSSVKFNVSPGITVSAIDEAAVASSSSQPPKSIPISFPKELNRPMWKDVDRDVLYSMEPDLAGMDMPFILDSVAGISAELYRALHTIQVQPARDVLPRTLAVRTTDAHGPLPTHMLAVFGRGTPPPLSDGSARARKIALYPVHSLVLMANCANLTAPPDTLSPPTPAPGMKEAELTLPIWPLCLPSPMVYPQLASYLYHKSREQLLKNFLPAPAPANLMRDPAVGRMYAVQLATTYTVQALIRNIITLHGLYQNSCALGIYDDVLWDTMDVMWRVLLTALAIATGDPGQMLTMRPSTQAL